VTLNTGLATLTLVEEIVNSSNGRTGVSALYLVCQPILLLRLKLAIARFVKEFLPVVCAILPSTTKPVPAIPPFLNAQLIVRCLPGVHGVHAVPLADVVFSSELEVLRFSNKVMVHAAPT
jgi:hypothetical protein